jgi:hypothetical protein
VFAQEEGDEGKVENKPIRPMYESAYLMDNQSSLVYPEKTLEFVMQHRFGTMENGISDFFGLYGLTNIRLGITYVPFKNLSVGYGITKDKMYKDLNLKYAIVTQTRSGSMPVSLTYYGNVAFAEENVNYQEQNSDRVSYYHQLIIARKVNSNLALQISPSYSHFNGVPAYLNENDEVVATMNNDHLALDISGRYKVSGQVAITAGYNLPLTDHPEIDPDPNLSFGFEVATSSHAFQIFFGQYKAIVPQENNIRQLGEEDEFLIGFNITRLWSF